MKPFVTAAEKQLHAAPLRKILLSAGCTIWAPQQVEKHKERELAKCKPPNIWWKFDQLCGAATPLVALVLLGAGLGFVSQERVIGCASISVALYMMFFAGMRAPASWNLCIACSATGTYYSAVHHASLSIPEFAQRTMRAVKAVDPSVKFRVLALEQTSELLDPFLIAVYNDEEIACDAWGENDERIFPNE